MTSTEIDTFTVLGVGWVRWSRIESPTGIAITGSADETGLQCKEEGSR